MLFRPDDEIRVGMDTWSVVEVTCTGLSNATRHLVGIVNGLGRVCSPIQDFDPSTMEATSRSGKIYELVGQPGKDPDAEYVFTQWCRLNDIDEYTDVTQEYWNENTAR